MPGLKTSHLLSHLLVPWCMLQLLPGRKLLAAGNREIQLKALTLRGLTHSSNISLFLVILGLIYAAVQHCY